MIYFKIFFIITITQCALADIKKPAGKIPEDYKKIQGLNAYKFHGDRKTWNEARKSCIKEGAHLAIVNSHPEDQQIYRIIWEHMGDEVWLGYHELFETGDWVTVLDQSFKDIGYVSWAPRKPNHWLGKEHCVGYQGWGSGGLDDYNCNKTYPYICEINLQK